MPPGPDDPGSEERRRRAREVDICELVPDDGANEVRRGSPKGGAAIGAVQTRIASGLVPVKARLEELKESQRLKRTAAGAVGGATAGALIGGALGAGVFSVPGALIGGAIGAVAGAAAGYCW